ncbi:MAG: RND transporter [Deltaproteobacteria bacterium]|nr:MAG: RND transporter [Deltaproteobacteria bacterium]
MYLILKNKFFFFFGAILFALPFIYMSPKVKTVDNVDYFNLKNHPDTLFFEKFKKTFENDEFFIIAYKKRTVFSEKNLFTLKKITGELESIKGIKEVKSLSNADETVGEKDFFIVREFLETIPQKKSDFEKLKKNAVSNPLFLDNFISEDGKVCAIIVYVEDNPLEPGYRKDIINKAREILNKYESQTGHVYFAGWTTTNYYLSQFMKKDIAVFIPVTYVLITLCLMIMLRNFYLTIIGVANISICMGSTMGLLPVFGITLNNVTTIVPPIIMALALCDTVHIFSSLDKNLLDKFGSKEKALAFILNKLFMPCFLTSLTTGIGFASLYISDIQPIREFSLIASIGMFFEFFYSFIFLPPLILFFPENKIFSYSREDRFVKNFLERIFLFVSNNFKLILLTGIFLSSISIFFTSKIQVETNLLKFFKKNSSIRIANRFMETNLAGVATLDVSVISDEDNAFQKPENLKYLEKIQNFSQSVQGVDKVVSFVDFIKEMNQSFNNEDKNFYKIPDSRQIIAQYLLIYDSDDIYDFINDYYSEARISLRLSEHSTAKQKKIITKIDNYIKSLDNNLLKTRITGRVLQDVNVIDSLVKGQLYSLSLAGLIIFGIMFIIFKSFRFGILSLVPNIFPVILNFGIMGLFGIPLNTATALISAVAIGIAVDDTIHFIMDFKNNLKSGMDVKDCLNKTILSKGKAVCLSSFILCIGFGVMVFSNFVPTIHFGFLSSFIMISAVIGDLFILSAAILFFDKKIKVSN